MTDCVKGSFECRPHGGDYCHDYCILYVEEDGGSLRLTLLCSRVVVTHACLFTPARDHTLSHRHTLTQAAGRRCK